MLEWSNEPKRCVEVTRRTGNLQNRCGCRRHKFQLTFRAIDIQRLCHRALEVQRGIARGGGNPGRVRHCGVAERIERGEIGFEPDRDAVVRPDPVEPHGFVCRLRMELKPIHVCSKRSAT